MNLFVNYMEYKAWAYARFGLGYHVTPFSLWAAQPEDVMPYDGFWNVANDSEETD